MVNEAKRKVTFELGAEVVASFKAAIGEARKEIKGLNDELSRPMQASMGGSAAGRGGFSRPQAAQADEYARTWKRAHAEVTTAVAARTQEVARLDRRLVESNRGSSEAFKKTISGAVALGRAITLLGVVGEKDLHKVIDSLAKFEAGAQAVRGLIDIVDGASKSYRVLTGSIVGATAAQRGLMGLTAGGLALPVLAGAAVAVAGGAAIESIVQGHRPRQQFGPVDPIMHDRSAFGTQARGSIFDLQRQRDFEIAGLENRRAAMSSSLGLSGAAASLAEAQAIQFRTGRTRDAAAARLDEVRQSRSSDPNQNSAEARNDALKRYNESLNQSIAAEQQMREARRASDNERIGQLSQQTGLLREQLQIEEQRLERQKLANLSGKERFGAASASEQRRMLAIAEQISQGKIGNLSAKDLEIARGLGLGSTVQGEFVRRADAGGFDRIASLQQQLVAPLEKAVQEASVKVRLKEEEIQGVKDAFQSFSDTITEQIMGMMIRVISTTKRETAEQIQRQTDELLLRRDSESAAGG